jgi:hypothetical protein
MLQNYESKKPIEDDRFGLLQWNTESFEWQGSITVAPHGEVDIGLPPEYLESNDIRKHIRDTMGIIERDERSFREKAANELFTKGGYVLFMVADQPFDHKHFVIEMHLANITFSTEYPTHPHTLNYEYGDDGMEHGIVIDLTWEGAYRGAWAG